LNELTGLYKFNCDSVNVNVKINVQTHSDQVNGINTHRKISVLLISDMLFRKT